MMSQILWGMGREVPERRCQILQMNAGLFLEILKGMDGLRLIRVTGIPEDAKVIGLDINPHAPDVINLLVESASFPLYYEDVHIDVWYPYLETRVMTPEITEDGNLLFKDVPWKPVVTD